jgi:hypothetical protein
MKYAIYAKENNKKITCYRFTHKYSLIFYGTEPVVFGGGFDAEDLRKALEEKDNLVIIKKKNIEEADGLKYSIIDSGRRYLLIEGK